MILKTNQTIYETNIKWRVSWHIDGNIRPLEIRSLQAAEALEFPA